MQRGEFRVDYRGRGEISRGYQTTVSRVINNHPYVSDEKEKKGSISNEAFGFVPNSAAKNFVNKNETIAVLVPRITNPFFKFIEAIEIALKYKYN